MEDLLGVISLKIRVEAGETIKICIRSEKSIFTWGDFCYGHQSVHTYAKAGVYRISITEKEMTDFILKNCRCITANFINCKKLKNIILDNNMLNDLTIMGCRELVGLFCKGNRLKNLFLVGLAQVNMLDCSNNEISDLSLSYNTRLRLLICSNNKIEKINISRNNSLICLECNNNELSESGLNEIFRKLRACDKGLLICNNNPGYQHCDKDKMEKKGWRISED